MKVKVNEHYSFDVKKEDKVWKVNGLPIQIDSKHLSHGHTHIIYQNNSYNIELVSENRADKSSVIKVNGNKYFITIEDQYDLLLKQLGMDNSQMNKVQEIKAPMPGLVINVMIEVGQEVSKGDNLLILEAMKMENVLKSPTSGIVKKILVNKGTKVEKNEILIQFS